MPGRVSQTPQTPATARARLTTGPRCWRGERAWSRWLRPAIPSTDAATQQSRPPNLTIHELDQLFVSRTLIRLAITREELRAFTGLEGLLSSWVR